jgi:hypothetical protein
MTGDNKGAPGQGGFQADRDGNAGGRDVYRAETIYINGPHSPAKRIRQRPVTALAAAAILGGGLLVGFGSGLVIGLNVVTPASGGSAPSAAPSADTALSSLRVLQADVALYTADSRQQIGATNYPDAIRFSCSAPTHGGHYSVTYDVAGFATLAATIGIPSNATNAAGNSAIIQFFKDGGPTHLGQTLTVSLDNPQTITLQLDNSSQLEIHCDAAKVTGTTGYDIDVVIGTATLSNP